MKELIAFIHDLYKDRTEKSVKFESKGRRIVSPLMSKDDAQELFKSLKKILPKEARLKIRESKQEPDQFRVVLLNPEKVFSLYAKHATELLNRFRPFPILSSEDKYYKWEYDSVSHLIKYSVPFSIIELDTEGKIPDTVEDAKQLKVIDQYNKKLQSTYPGLRILGSNSEEDEGDDIFFLTLNYSNYKAINSPPSLRDIGIEFFRKHREHYTTEVAKKIPGDMTDEFTDIEPSSTKPSSTGS
ncbi:TPA: type IV secretion protein Dot [Legionella pneumophila]|nr:type IV secretion protein Dot [Legionella pneumophila subsp. pneumophila]HAU2156700.1 type IV secretion protein Dot [Legionella pneumophila]